MPGDSPDGEWYSNAEKKESVPQDVSTRANTISDMITGKCLFFMIRLYNIFPFTLRKR
jgi:hypothetical protein